MEVRELESGDLFTLNCENNHTVYEFVKNEVGEKDEIVSSSIIVVAGWWPESARGKGQPEQWTAVIREVRNCNPYAEVTRVVMTFKNI